jgi:hypothetical protein
MVDVQWNFEEGELDRAAAEKAVGKVLAFHQQALAGITCPIHQREPSLIVEGRTPQTLRVSIEACCGKLLEKAHYKVRGVSRRDEECF